MKSDRSRFLDEVPNGCIEPAEVTRGGRKINRTTSDVPSPFGRAGAAMPSFRPDISAKAVHAPDAFEKGVAVSHPRFGRGVVVDVNGEGEEKIAVVKFDTAGEKKMFVAFAPLKIG